MYKTWMMKTLLLSTSLAMLAACNEKIAPELADPASTTTTSGSSGGGPTVTESENVFKLELDTTPTNNVDPADLGYTLHKANEAGTVECEIEDVTDVPDTLGSSRDITCMLEAEEAALYYNGYKIKAVGDAGTCNFISAQPYTYYQYQPGVSARMDGSPREVVKFVCTDTAQQLHAGAVLHTDATSVFGANASGSTTVTELCGSYVNIDDDGSPVAYGTLNLSATATPVSLASDSELCSFNYRNEGVNCDEGQVRVHTVNVSSVNIATVDTLTAISGGSVLVECGGKVKNCIGGAAPQIVGATNFIDLGKTLIISQIPAAGGSNDVISLSADVSRESNFYFSNFMRQCSGLPNFTGAANFNTSPTFSPGYDASTMEEYARLGTTLPGTQEKDLTHGQFDVITLADDPFRAGIPDADITIGDLREDWSNSNMQARPFHSFECLDQALDVKARIRLVVREWNRNFSPTTQEFRFISDVFSATAKMDAGSAQTDNFLVYDQFNDIQDWDDFLFFTNSPTNSCSTSSMIDDGPGGLPDPRSPLWFPGEDN